MSVGNLIYIINLGDEDESVIFIVEEHLLARHKASTHKTYSSVYRNLDRSPFPPPQQPPDSH